MFISVQLQHSQYTCRQCMSVRGGEKRGDEGREAMEKGKESEEVYECRERGRERKRRRMKDKEELEEEKEEG